MANKILGWRLMDVSGNCTFEKNDGDNMPLVDEFVISVVPVIEHVVDWHTDHGCSTAFCPACQVELGLTEVFYTEANPVYGEQDYVCPTCKEVY